MTVQLTKRAARGLDGLKRARPAMFEKLIGKIESLSSEPRAGKPLVGPLKGKCSLRVGDYRIIYELLKGAVVILTVNHRREVYR